MSSSGGQISKYSETERTGLSYTSVSLNSTFAAKIPI
jgi:hypothetical protein